jgi:predicted ATP-grasp superfamily ATP-dependent carboligase
MLAHSADRAGLRPLVIDLFADQDTQDVAEDFQKVKSLATKDIVPVIDLYIHYYHVRDVVYGSGLEAFPESLDLLNHKLNILGNAGHVFHCILDKEDFFRRLNKLDIPFPQVQFHAPEKKGQWLIKPLAGEGGVGIRQWQADNYYADTQTKFYWQRQIDGISMSALFLADGRNVQVIGFNQQWTESDSYVFSGIIKSTEQPAEIQFHVEYWLTKLVPEFNLQGLNSLDFVVNGEQSQVLEINPRPSASMVLYDAEYKSGLLQEHINACSGRITFDRQSSSEIIALQVLYASKDLHISAEFDWPDWSMDRPVCPCIIHRHQPICSIIATDFDAQRVYQQLQYKQQIIINSIEGQ